MTIQEAIEHCEEVAGEEGCTKCAEQHLQLKDWLEELILLRELFNIYDKSGEDNLCNKI